MAEIISYRLKTVKNRRKIEESVWDISGKPEKTVQVGENKNLFKKWSHFFSSDQG